MVLCTSTPWHLLLAVWKYFVLNNIVTTEFTIRKHQWSILKPGFITYGYEVKTPQQLFQVPGSNWVIS